MKTLTWLYALNTTLLYAHEIDSAYWQEWKLFGIPGGAGGFVLMHIPLLLLALWGFERLLAEARAGLVMSVVLGVCGLAALVIHGSLIYRGRPEFCTPVSLGLLGAMAAVSGVQLVLTAGRVMRRASAP